MKIIEILNKIANGEDVPKKFMFAGQIFEKRGSYIEDEDGDSIFYSMCTDFSNINDEIEIIEEDKKIEYIEGRIKNFKHYIEDSCFRVQPLEDLELNQNEVVIIDKINEIIDKINEMENK